jgi:glycerol-3-phosphate dehydrogenase (NAD(P)+)
VGTALAQGKTLSEAVDSLGQVAEGVPTLKVALRLSEEKGVEVPLMTTLNDVMMGVLEFDEAISRLMERNTRFEMGGE